MLNRYRRYLALLVWAIVSLPLLVMLVAPDPTQLDQREARARPMACVARRVLELAAAARSHRRLPRRPFWAARRDVAWGNAGGPTPPAQRQREGPDRSRRQTFLSPL